MTAAALPLYSSHAIRDIDRCLATQLGISSFELMQRAGRAIAQHVLLRYPAIDHFLVLCGEGNNGGDGYIVATQLRAAGRSVLVWRRGEPESEKSPDAARAYATYVQAGGAFADELSTAITRSELIIDALLGIGTPRDLSWLAAVAHTVNTSGKPVVAVDLPSGLHPDTGSGDFIIRADLCICLIALKTGLFNGRAKAFRGELLLESLQVNAQTLATAASSGSCRRNAAITQLRRDRNAHKGSFGHVLVVAGGEGYAGAARLCVAASLRAGAGLVSYLTDSSHVLALQVGEPEAMALGNFPEPEAKAKVLAAGPGLTMDSMLLRNSADKILAWPHPRVLDADFLNYLASFAQPTALGLNTIITPHPAEAARLLKCSVAEIETDRVNACQMLAKQLECAVVLKGAITIIAVPDQLPVHCDLGNPGMASGGSGDVLTGIIAALLAQGLDAFEAATQGVIVHAQAGDMAAKRGERGMLARDLLEALRHVLNEQTI
jgi:ADP-dependent NAD(P)H-hydrate dehydratase / NAD(P)H-hydrate epimerase